MTRRANATHLYGACRIARSPKCGAVAMTYAEFRTVDAADRCALCTAEVERRKAAKARRAPK